VWTVLPLSIPTARLGCFGRKIWNYLCYDGATRRSKLIGGIVDEIIFFASHQPNAKSSDDHH
jgi:hypothetical protein